VARVDAGTSSDLAACLRPAIRDPRWLARQWKETDLMTHDRVTIPADGLVLLAAAYLGSVAATAVLDRMPDRDAAISVAAVIWPMLALAEPYARVYAMAWNRLAATGMLEP
jgi:hypothetical protein